MRDNAEGILDGIEIIKRLVKPQRIVIAIEDNKPEAVAAMRQALSRYSVLAGNTRVTVIPTKYPSGGEKQLIQIITGKEVPTGAIPASQGILVQNVGTAFAIADAVQASIPLIERVVTVTGNAVSKPGNYWVPIGTPVSHLLQQCGFDINNSNQVIVGGPMMGYTLPLLDVPVLKGTNCILAPAISEFAEPAEARACIRCGECAQVCPAQLLPQQLYWHSKAEEYDKAQAYNLRDCIECGCCSYVCPSEIPLVEHYRIAKSAIRNQELEKHQAEKAKQHFEAKQKRLEDEKRHREERAKQAAAQRKVSMNAGDKDAIAEAMARIQAKKAAAQAGTAEPNAAVQDTNKSSQVAAAIARAKAKKQPVQNQAPRVAVKMIKLRPQLPELKLKKPLLHSNMT